MPLAVANDGDVTALAGAMSLGENNILGIAMGTVGGRGLRGRGRQHHRLAQRAGLHACGSADPDAMADEWSGDIGCGVQVLLPGRRSSSSAPRAGIELPTGRLPRREAEGRPGAYGLRQRRGGGRLPQHRRLPRARPRAVLRLSTSFKHVLLLRPRDVAGKRRGRRALPRAGRCSRTGAPGDRGEDHSPPCRTRSFRRVGQSAAAASLPEIK